VVDISDYDGRPIYFWGDHDPRVTRACVDSLRPGEVFLDIGANFGEVALAAAAKVGPSGAVHAFEPNERIAAYLRRSAALNGFSHLFVHQVALGSTDGEAELFGPAGHSGAASVLASNETDALDRSVSYGKVAIRNAGSYVREVCDRPISAMKIDAEGSEGPILESMEAILREDRPRMICFESHNSGTPFFERESVRCLNQIGYRFEQIVIDATFSLKPKLADVLPGHALLCGHDFVARYVD
jgi:FkbM family methyltransferase